MIRVSDKFLLALLLLSILIIPLFSAYCQPKINIVYPKEGDHIIASDSTFIYGNVWPRSSQVRVNKKLASVFRNGSFLAIVPVKPGKFSFSCETLFDDDTTTATRNVYIPGYLKSSSKDTLTIDTSYVFPKMDWELQPGDVFKVAFKGSPGKKATFSIVGLINDLPMVELAPKKSYYWGEAIFRQSTNSQMAEVRGIYTGSYIIQPWDWAAGRKIIFKIVDNAGKEKKFTAPGKLSIDLSTIPKIGQLTENVKRARSGPRIGSQLFLPKGTRVLITAKRGNHVRIRYSESNEIWIKKESIEILPPGTTQPEGIVTAIRTTSKEKWNDVELILDQRLPFLVEQITNPARLEITFYGISSTADSIRLEMNNPFIRDIRWEPVSQNAHKLKIELNQRQHWGYNPVFENGNFYLHIKKAPKIARWPNSPLKNLVICLDPGHGPDLGAVGPSGIPEKNINYDYCSAMKLELENKGARVVLTRNKNNGLSLSERENFAESAGADILISVHFNGLPDGVDALKVRGISTYYNQPQSYRLAYFVHNNLLEETKLQNFGFYYSNLSICRIPHTISVLIEPGFLTHPLEEMLITSEHYKMSVVSAVVNALEDFCRESR